MTLKKWVLAGAILALAAASLYMNTDWFRGGDIQIVHRPVPEKLIRNRRPAKFGETRVVPILFSFDRKLALTEVKVVNTEEVETNKFAHPLWHLESDSNSVPTMGITYGGKVPGMRPAVKDATPDPCEPGVKYRLIVRAGSRQAIHDFVLQGPSR
jgi:hypothetical protein